MITHGSICTMDKPLKKSKSHESSFPKPGRSQKENAKTPLNITEHGMIKAARENDINKVQLYLGNIYFDPNITDRWKNTALHRVALNNNHELIDLLLKDPRPDASLKNFQGFTAQDLVDRDKEEAIALRRKLFARYCLNIQVNNHTEKIRQAYKLGAISPDVINGTIEFIKQELKNDCAKQTSDRQMPSDAQLAEYATDEFIKKMIDFRLTHPIVTI